MNTSICGSLYMFLILLERYLGRELFDQMQYLVLVFWGISLLISIDIVGFINFKGTNVLSTLYGVFLNYFLIFVDLALFILYLMSYEALKWKFKIFLSVRVSFNFLLCIPIWALSIVHFSIIHTFAFIRSINFFLINLRNKLKLLKLPK